MLRVPHRVLLVLALLVPGAPSAGQEPAAAGSWNSGRALELMERARARRLLPQQDTTLRNYTARAEGFVYFYLDRRGDEERTLVKVDQVALELYWTPPNRTSQRIVGLRDVSRLPNRMNYHLDHLTVVQNGFGDVIRMGDGDEVRDVPHPAAPGAEAIYEFRLADSLTLRLPNAAEPIRVYELEVRPLRTDRPALVGSVFVDRASGDIVRMSFTFTAVSYVDPRLDYISVSLDNGLWEGRYWLPHEQTLQIRRQIPELDFAAGAVIQGRMRISDYVFNDSVPGRPPAVGVTAVPRAEREAFAFEREIYDDLNAAGLEPPPDLDAIRQRATELLGARRLSGLPRIRFALGSASSALRYNRAEGIAAGVGLVYAPTRTWRLDVEGGYAFGPDRPWAAVEASSDGGSSTNVSFRAAYRDYRDMGIAPALPGAVNTLSALFLGRDYTDPYHVTGAGIRLTRPLGRALRMDVELAGERHISASRTQSTALLNDGREFRAVRQIDDGDLSFGVVTLRRPMPDARADDWSVTLATEVGAFAGSFYVRPTVGAAIRRSSADHRRDIVVAGSAGMTTADAPSQRLFLLGGQGTLSGYPFRSFAGTRYALMDAQASQTVLEPWLRLRLVGSVGAAGGLRPDDVAADGELPAWQAWNVRGTDGIRTSAGGGVSVFWDVLRMDAVRGLNGGDWRFVLSFHPDLRDIS
ncbi:MAG TPA: hypothetical protein VK933_12070 [Longimicrobiales bacterium]|nr:hypothetical protein [Longimicrobiales bacterium]